MKVALILLCFSLAILGATCAPASKGFALAAAEVANTKVTATKAENLKTRSGKVDKVEGVIAMSNVKKGVAMAQAQVN